jgi:hypothetical protein
LAEGEVLAAKRNVSVILRLVLDEQGRLQQGEALDAEGRPGGRFDGWEAMVSVIRRMVEEVGD